MPDRKTLERVKQDKKEGKSASTQAGEFVREEMDHIREGKHGARSSKQAIAIGLSKARRAGVELPPPKKGKTSAETQRKAARDSEVGEEANHKVSGTRSHATINALKHEPRTAASKTALSKHARFAARRRSGASRSASARKAAATKGSQGHSQAARKAAHTRAASRHATG